MDDQDGDKKGILSDVCCLQEIYYKVSILNIVIMAVYGYGQK